MTPLAIRAAFTAGSEAETVVMGPIRKRKSPAKAAQAQAEAARARRKSARGLTRRPTARMAASDR